MLRSPLLQTSCFQPNVLSILLSVALLSVVVIPVDSAPAPKALPPKQEAPPKTVKLPFVNAPWREAFTWHVEETGTPVIPPPRSTNHEQSMNNCNIVRSGD